MLARRASRALLYVGTAGVVLGLGKFHAAAIGDYDLTGSARFAWSLAFVGLLALVAYGAGLPDLAASPRQAAAAAVATGAGGAVAMSLCQLATGSAVLPRFVVFGSAAAVVPWYVLCAALASGGRSRAEERDRVVLVARRDEAAALREELGRNPERHASVVHAFTVDEARSDAGRPRPVAAAVESTGASVVVLARDAQADESVVAQVAELHERGTRVRTLSMFYEQWLGKLPVAELERVSLMFDVGELHRARYGRLKRLADVALAAAALPVLAVAAPVVAVGNLVGNRGPLLYRQERVGRGGAPFRILKFRTMTPGDGPSAWTSEGDSRITPFGGLLRRTHLDELPQALNVLRGELSIVGPRPEQRQYVAELADKLPFYDLRHLVRPGITGWAQVKYGYAGTTVDALEKLQYEFYYLRHQGLALDLRIVARTVRSVLGGRGR